MTELPFQASRRLLKAVIQASEEDGFSIHDELMAEFSAALTVNKDFPELQGSSLDGQSLESLCCKLYAYCRHGSCEEPPWVQLEDCEERHLLESIEGRYQQSSNGLPSACGTASKGIIAISVSRDILAGGTGCHEWEAGFFLAEFVLNNPNIFKGKQVFSYLLIDGWA